MPQVSWTTLFLLAVICGILMCWKASSVLEQPGLALGGLDSARRVLERQKNENVSLESLQAEVMALRAIVGIDDEAAKDNSRIIRRPLLQRLRHVERKVDGATNWVKDPQLMERVTFNCKKLQIDDHTLCLKTEQGKELLKPNSCLVYDMGIREQPEFGLKLAKKYKCTVRAFDPSPVSQRWWAREKESIQQTTDNRYSFYPYGAGGIDGNIDLFEYDWGQVAIVKADWLENNSGKFVPTSPSLLKLPVKRLSTIMKQMGDEGKTIDVLKLDIEGSEFPLLQDIFDNAGCPPARQLIVEWHHFGLDEKYGSSPDLNTIVNFLQVCGFRQSHYRAWWPVEMMQNPSPAYKGLRWVLRYGLASFIRA